ncbi:MAG TPA: type II toxin-antitoxin system PemK/MazF family toxin [archaeon]|nr:type II toxin-antitoxin system PemK/MazF family toxin [archaeon]
MTIEQGELVVADILFAEQDSKKRRLALVISGNKYNKTSKDIVVLKVTSKINNSQYSVNLTNDSTIKKALKKESIIRADFPVTIAKQNIISNPDKISPEKLEETKAKLRKFYEL